MFFWCFRMLYRNSDSKVSKMNGIGHNDHVWKLQTKASETKQTQPPNAFSEKNIIFSKDLPNYTYVVYLDWFLWIVSQVMLCFKDLAI